MNTTHTYLLKILPLGVLLDWTYSTLFQELGNEILNAFELLLITKIRFDNAVRSNYRAVMIFVWKSFQNDPLPNKGIHDDCLQFQSYNTTLIKTIGTLFFMI